MLTQTDSNLQLNIPYLRKLPTIPPSRPSPLARAGKIAISVYSVILHFSRCDTFLSANSTFISLLFFNNIGKENPTVKTIHDDIAHLTCSASGNRLPSVKWERDGKELTDESLGIVIISWDNGTQVNSHLIIAVNGDERWGKYTCVVSSDGKETRETFVIERGEKG